MASVMDYIDCPNCSKEAYSDYYYKTGEEYINCSNCGYHYSATIINRDKKLTELVESDWEINELKKPYGAYRYKMAGEVGYCCGSLKDKKDAIRFITEMRLEYQGYVEFAQINRVIRGKIITTNIIDNGPEFDSAGFSELDR